MAASTPHNRPSRENPRRASAALRVARSGPDTYAVVFLDDAGSPGSVVATFPGPMSAEMYGKIVGGRFRVVRMSPARYTH
ncbi:hypothetical protein [Frankia gtarii]|uniref:hypothetical protein n=1 Tax=Frankia gtarii TaxID=2950102 RepID=UPI0021BEA8BD|nr:hypothetical protein [Frankia gtarii]